MSNVNLTIDDITHESLRVLHQKSNFIGNVVRDYDGSYAKTGAKIGDTLRIRLPVQYNTGTGATMATGTGADSIGTSTTLRVSTQRHVPMRFTSAEMATDIDDFSKRHIEPAMTKLAAMIENDCIATAMAGTAQLHQAATLATPVWKDIMEVRKILQDSLTPGDARTFLLDSQCVVDMNDALKGLYNDQGQISKMFLEGMITRAQGFTFFENTLLPDYTAGVEDAGDAAYDVNVAQSMTVSATDNDPNTMTLAIDQGTKTITNGQVFTIAGVYDVHPETKATRAALKRFTVVSGAQATATSIVITPAIIAAGPHQNCSAVAANDAALTFLNADASTTFHQSLAFQKGAFAFGTADLLLPPKEESSRKVFDGISMRMVMNAYDVVKDRLYTRLDILYGFKEIRPDLACKMWHT